MSAYASSICVQVPAPPNMNRVVVAACGSAYFGVSLPDCRYRGRDTSHLKNPTMCKRRNAHV